MEYLVQSRLVEIRRDNTKGRGGRAVHAREVIAADTVIESVPVLLLPKNQLFGNEAHPGTARVTWYVFDWKIPTHRPYVALALGYGSIYNHSFTPNAFYRCVAPDLMEFVALRDIPEGEEITINYNGEPTDRTPMAFEVSD